VGEDSVRYKKVQAGQKNPHGREEMRAGSCEDAFLRGPKDVGKLPKTKRGKDVTETALLGNWWPTYPTKPPPKKKKYIGNRIEATGGRMVSKTGSHKAYIEFLEKNANREYSKKLFNWVWVRGSNRGCTL